MTFNDGKCRINAIYIMILNNEMLCECLQKYDIDEIAFDIQKFKKVNIEMNRLIIY